MAAADRVIAKVILETDSLMLKQVVECDDNRFAEARGYIYQLKSLISGSFSNCLLMFAPRSCNKVAHALADVGSSCSNGDDVLWDFTPPCVSDLVASDLSVPCKKKNLATTCISRVRCMSSFNLSISAY
jgi:hypothetical protein